MLAPPSLVRQGKIASPGQTARFRFAQRGRAPMAGRVTVPRRRAPEVSRWQSRRWVVPPGGLGVLERWGVSGRGWEGDGGDRRCCGAVAIKRGGVDVVVAGGIGGGESWWGPRVVGGQVVRVDVWECDGM